MSRPGDDLVESVLAALPSADRYVVAFSGGGDSTTLLAVLAGRVPLRAVHVEHGLQAAARDWPVRCADICERLQVPLRCLTVDESPPAANREAWAREQRYAVLAADLGPGEVLLTAHHADDQAETLLLNLLRGSGLEGLAAMPGVRSLGRGHLARPLLGVGRAQLRSYCRALGLAWVSDPSNRDPEMDRNFLRHEILPRLRQRWPAASGNLARSAGHLAHARAVELEMADHLLEGAENPAGGLEVAALQGYSFELRVRLLKRWIARQGLPAPRTHQWPEIWRQLAAPADRQVCVTWPGATLHRYRNAVYVEGVAPPQPAAQPWRLTQPLEWPGYGVLLAQAWPPSWAPAELQARPPVGGERIRLAHGGPSRRLKALWQDAGVPPWERLRTPLLYRGEDLVAVGDRWIAASAGGLQIRRQSEV